MVGMVLVLGPVPPTAAVGQTSVRFWHSTLVSAEPFRASLPLGAPAAGRPEAVPRCLVRPPEAGRRRGQAGATNIRAVMAGPSAMVDSPTIRVNVPSGALDWITAVMPGVSPWSPR